MCMGKTHARQGLCGGVAVATLIPPSLGTPLPLPLMVAVTVLTTGAAVFPDIDHPEATVAHTFGPLSHGVSKAVHATSSAIYALTSSRHDQDRDGGHRGITHTLLFAALCGTGTTALISAAGIWGLGTMLLLFSSFMIRGLAGRWARRRGWFMITGMSFMITMALVFTLTPGPVTALWFGLAVGAGCVVHVLGDAMTTEGCPIFFPLPIHRKRWHMAGSPHALRFHTSKDSMPEAVLGWLSLFGAGMLTVFAIIHTVAV